MLLDAITARTLFAIVLTATQGAERLRTQQPLHVTDRGELWLVTGMPYTKKGSDIQFSQCAMFFDKRNSEIKGIDCVARFVLLKRNQADLSKVLTREQLEALTTPVKRFEPNGIPPLIMALSGGLVPTSTAAVDYAAALLHTSGKRVALASSDLTASESDGVWHARRRGEQTDLMTLSKTNGRLLSGDL